MLRNAEAKTLCSMAVVAWALWGMEPAWKETKLNADEGKDALPMMNGTGAWTKAEAEKVAESPTRQPLTGQLCFPADAVVHTSTGDKPMAALKVGDEVLAFDGYSVGYSPVWTFIHADGESRALYLRVHSDSGHELLVSANHLVYSPPAGVEVEASSFESHFKFASKLRPGDLLFVRDGSKGNRYTSVTKMEETEAVGIYAPVTETGTLVVNGVLASSYASLENQQLMSSIFAYFRRILGGFPFPASEARLPGPLRLLLSLANLALPSSSF